MKYLQAAVRQQQWLAETVGGAAGLQLDEQGRTVWYQVVVLWVELFH